MRTLRRQQQPGSCAGTGASQGFLQGFFGVSSSRGRSTNPAHRGSACRETSPLLLQCIRLCWMSYGGNVVRKRRGLERNEFDRILLLVAMAQNFGLPPAEPLKRKSRQFFRSLKLADLVLAKACASGNERAWEHFMAVYGQPLTRAAIAISGSETVGRDLADAFYAELYGLNTREGERRCPLDSYRGRGYCSAGFGPRWRRGLWITTGARIANRHLMTSCTILRA